MRPLALLLILLLPLVACATTPPPSAGVVPVAAWKPPLRPRAQIVALHGFNDHKGAFAEFGAHAARHGVLVHAYDQPGFGEQPNRGFWPGQDALEEALLREIAMLRAQHPALPIYVLGESMGAAVATAALAREDAPHVDGVILSAPAVWGGATFNPLYRAVLWTTSRILPGLSLTGRGLGIMASDNIEMLRALGRDPLYIKETRVDAIEGLVRLMDAARAAAPNLGLPLLVLMGQRDEVVPPSVQLSFAGTLTASPCRAVLYPEGWHLLLRDLQRELVWRDVLAWVLERDVPSGLGQSCSVTAGEVASGTS